MVYFERFKYIKNAIAREKYLKHCTRAEKIPLISQSNPTWEDLAAELEIPDIPRSPNEKQILRFAKDDKHEGVETDKADHDGEDDG